MTIMQQSSRAQDRALGVWFQHIQQGVVKLPRLHHFEAWDLSRINSFVNTTVSHLTVAVAQDVAGVEKFEVRYVSCAAVDSGTMA